MIYLFISFFSMIIAYILNELKVKKFLYIVSLLPLIILGVLRYNVGIDYGSYTNNHIPMILLGLDVKFEFLARQIVYFGYYLSDYNNYIYIFAIFHIVFMIFMGLYIKKNSTNLVFSIYILGTCTFYNFALSGIRQSIATVLAFSGIYLLSHKKFKNIILFIILIYISTLFHNSSILYLVFLLLAFIKPSPKVGVMYILTAILVLIFGDNLIKNIMYEFSFYEEYIGSKFFQGEYTRLHQVFVIFLSSILNIIFYFIDNAEKYRLNLQININYILLAVAICMGIFPTPSRIVYMFLPIYIILIPNIYGLIKKTNNKLLYISFIFFIFLIFFIYSIMYKNFYETLPYKTFINF